VTSGEVEHGGNVVGSLSSLDLPGLSKTIDLAYPIADHIADKLNGIMALRTDGRLSTRYRDLIDLVLLAREWRVKEVIAFQHAQGQAALAWLRHRTGWQ